MEKLIQYATKASFYDGPFDSKVGWSAAGMGYILRTAHGRFIVIDGGYEEDSAALVRLLEEHGGGEKPVVDYWILTHPHRDHYGALTGICEDEALLSRIEIRRLVYRFPREFRDAKGRDVDFVFPRFAERLAPAGAETVCPAAGMTLETDGMRIRFLAVPDGSTSPADINQLSLIFTVQGKKRMLFTGDAYRPDLEAVLRRCPDELPSDILQMPHHGLCDTGVAAFYRKADAKTVLIPISAAGWRTMHSDMYGHAPDDNRFAEENAETVVRACDGTAVLPLE